MNNYLQQSMENKEVISLYCGDKENAVFSVGIILQFTDEFVLVGLIDPNGVNDGWEIIRRRTIHHIDISGEYEKKISTLRNLRKQPEFDFLPKMSGSLLHTFCNYAKKNNLIISFLVNDDEPQTFSGIIKELNLDNIVLENVSDYGIPQEQGTINLDSISRAAIGSDYEESIQLLYDNRFRLHGAGNSFA